MSVCAHLCERVSVCVSCTCLGNGASYYQSSVADSQSVRAPLLLCGPDLALRTVQGMAGRCVRVLPPPS